jgi:hypothetical protein
MVPYQTNLVQINKFSRSGLKLHGVYGFILHWTANPGASDTAHQVFFDGADGGGGRYAGAHFFVDRDSATLIVPLDEVAYHANESACRLPDKLGKNANYTTIGIEMCVGKDGTIHPETVERTAQLVAHLCSFYKLGANDLYRHFDITGKNCPAPWVANPQLFVDFKANVNNKLNPPKAEQPKPSIVYEAHVQDIGWQGKRKDGQTAGTTGKSLRLEALTITLKNTDVKLEMQGHIQNKGWTTLRSNGEVIGTIGEALRLEAIKIKADGLNVAYRVHVQDNGWSSWMKNGEVAGTTGQSKRIEAIEIKLA